MDQESSAERLAAKHSSDRLTLAVALVLNVVMFCIGLIGWHLAKSAAVLADALDMLADASGYAIAYLAIGGSALQQRVAARWNGAMLIALGLSVFAEVADRWLRPAAPNGKWIMAFACLSLLVNGTVLRMLAKYRRSSEVHLRAAWIDTRADVLVNLGVLAAGALVVVSGYRLIDLATGVVIAGFVMHEGWELWESGGSDKPNDAS